MKILLIEDDEVKRASVQNAIVQEIPSCFITTTHSVRKAIDTLANESFDLIVADMSLPTFDVELKERGGSARPFGGVEVFDYLERIGSTLPVLVVTSYPVLTEGSKSLSVKDLQEQLSRDFPDNFRGIIYFNSVYLDWEIELRDFLAGQIGSIK